MSFTNRSASHAETLGPDRSLTGVITGAVIGVGGNVAFTAPPEADAVKYARHRTRPRGNPIALRYEAADIAGT